MGRVHDRWPRRPRPPSAPPATRSPPARAEQEPTSITAERVASPNPAPCDPGEGLHEPGGGAVLLPASGDDSKVVGQDAAQVFRAVADDLEAGAVLLPVLSEGADHDAAA